MNSQRGQAITESLLGLLLLGGALISLGHVFNRYWEQTRCEAILFSETRSKLQGDIFFSKTFFLVTPQAVTGQRVCLGKVNSLTLPKLETHPKWK